jgi:hypothetical protein
VEQGTCVSSAALRFPSAIISSNVYAVLFESRLSDKVCREIDVIAAADLISVVQRMVEQLCAVAPSWLFSAHSSGDRPSNRIIGRAGQIIGRLKPLEAAAVR